MHRASKYIPGLGKQFFIRPDHISAVGGAEKYMPRLGKDMEISVAEISSKGGAEKYIPGLGKQFFINPNHIGGKLLSPVGFTWQNNPLSGTMYIDPVTRQVFTTFSMKSVENVGTGKDYYVSKQGNDANDGLSWATAFKTWTPAIGKADVKRIYIGAGMYNRAESTNGVAVTKSLELVGVGDVRVGGHDTLTWTLVAGETNVYQATRTNVARVFDGSIIDSNGYYTELVKKTTQAEVSAAAGSWAQVGSLVYVRTANNRMPDANLFAYLLTPGISAKNGAIYLENIKFEGGSLPVKMESETVQSYIYAKNVSTRYSGTGNGWNMLGVTSILMNCEAAMNTDDGFNYHLSTNTTYNSKAIEINCVGKHNGISSDTDNGSTMHDGGYIIRFGGKYYGNKGPNVADVTTGTESWNIGVNPYDSAGGGVLNIDFQISDTTAGAVKSWLDGCYTKGSVSTANVVVGDAASVVKIRNSILLVKSGTATIDY